MIEGAQESALAPAARAEAQKCAKTGQKNAFREQLANDTAARRAERDSD